MAHAPAKCRRRALALTIGEQLVDGAVTYCGRGRLGQLLVCRRLRHQLNDVVLDRLSDRPQGQHTTQVQRGGFLADRCVGCGLDSIGD